MKSDAELDAWLRELDDELLDDVRRDIDKEVVLKGMGVLRAARGRGRRIRVRLLVRAYWRDTLCVIVGLVAVVWLALQGVDMVLGWLR